MPWCGNLASPLGSQWRMIHGAVKLGSRMTEVQSLGSAEIMYSKAFMRCGGTGIRELTRGLATLPQRWIQEPLVVTDMNWRPQEDPLAVHCFCVCSGSALFWGLGIIGSMERDLLSVQSIYPRIFLHAVTVYRLLVGFLFVWLYSTICSCVLVVMV